MERSDSDDVIIARAERAMAETRLLVARNRRLQELGRHPAPGPTAGGGNDKMSDGPPLPAGRRNPRLNP